MTLQENAFMYDLIKRSFRRRMVWYWIYTLMMVVPVYFIIFVDTTTKLLPMGAFLLIEFFLLLVFGMLFLGERNPWTIKKNQLKVLIEQRDANFEQLQVCVPVQEYFYL